MLGSSETNTIGYYRYPHRHWRHHRHSWHRW